MLILRPEEVEGLLAMPRPFPTLEETKVVLEELKRRAAKPESFVDLSLLQELEKEKFFEKLSEQFQIQLSSADT